MFALQLALSWPLPPRHLTAALGVVPRVMYGIALISRLHLWPQTNWLLLFVPPYAVVAWQEPLRCGKFGTQAGRVPGSSGSDGPMSGAAWQNHCAARARAGLIRDQPGSAGRRASRSVEAVS